MSLLNVPYLPFPRVLSSPSAPSSRPSASTTSVARSRCNSPSAPSNGYPSLKTHLTDFFSDTDPEHTPINIPDSHHDFMCPDDVTMIPTSPEGLPNSEAFSSSQKAAASRVSCLFGHLSLGKVSAGHVSGRTGLQETGAVLDREFVATTLCSSQPNLWQQHHLKAQGHCFVNPTANTGYEPNFCRYMNEEHTPINLPDNHRDDATIIPYSGASSTSKQTAASRVPTMLESLGASLWEQRPESVGSRASIQATGAEVDRESVVPTFFSSQAKGDKRSRYERCAFVERQRKSPKDP